MQDRITINGEPYISVKALQQMRASIISELSSMLCSVESVEKKEAPEQLELPVASRPLQLDKTHGYMDEIVRQVRQKSVPTAALLNQKAVIYDIDDEEKIVRIKMPRPFVELFMRTPQKMDLLIKAAKVVFWPDATVELVTAPVTQDEVIPLAMKLKELGYVKLNNIRNRRTK